MTGWFAAHSEDIWVNVVSSLPFLLIDLVIIALVLPQAIEWWSLFKTRKLRGNALAFAVNAFSMALPNLRQAALTADRSDLLEYLRQGPQRFLDQIDNAMPPLFTVLDRTSIWGLFELRAVASAYLTAFIAASRGDFSTLEERSEAWKHAVGTLAMRSASLQGHDRGYAEAILIVLIERLAEVEAALKATSPNPVPPSA